MPSEPLWAYLAHLDPGSFKFQINIKPLICSDFLIKSLLKLAILGPSSAEKIVANITIERAFGINVFSTLSAAAKRY